MIEFLDLLFFGPEIEGLQKGIAPLVLAGIGAAGFIQGGGLQGIIGGGERRREEQRAQNEQRKRRFDYENPDFNQDVGAINNPYGELAKSTQEFSQRNLDQNRAEAIDAQRRTGQFGATTGILQQQNRAQEQANQRIQGIRQAGLQFVEQQRQQRVQQRIGRQDTLYAASEHRLAAAKRARTKATESLVSGIASGVTAAGAGAVSGFSGGEFDATKALRGSGLVSDALFNPPK